MRLSKFINSLIPRLICTALAILLTTAVAYVLSIWWIESWKPFTFGIYLGMCGLIAVDLGRAYADAKGV